MTTRFGFPLLFVVVLSAAAMLSAQAQPSPDECSVWQRELSFARSVDNHDAKAFAAHLSPGAVFSAGTREPVRSKDKVLAEWAPLIEGKIVHLRWHPDVVNIGGNPNVAISRGPFTIEDTRPDAKAKYKVGYFMTVWTRQSATAPWLVLFDGGEPPATPVDDLAAAEKFMSSAATGCSAK